MHGWSSAWNLSADSTFLDVGSGYGKVVLHTQLVVGCRATMGIECVTSRHLIADQALAELSRELAGHDEVLGAEEPGEPHPCSRSPHDTRLALRQAREALSGVRLVDGDVTHCSVLHFSHLYIFDRVFSDVTIAALAAVLARSNFLVMVSSKAPKVWWANGLRKAFPVARLRFATTGKERCTCFVYVNADLTPWPPSYLR